MPGILRHISFSLRQWGYLSITFTACNLLQGSHWIAFLRRVSNKWSKFLENEPFLQAESILNGSNEPFLQVMVRRGLSGEVGTRYLAPFPVAGALDIEGEGERCNSR